MKEINLVNEAQTHPLFCFDARSVHLHVFFFPLLMIVNVS